MLADSLLDGLAFPDPEGVLGIEGGIGKGRETETPEPDGPDVGGEAQPAKVKNRIRISLGFDLFMY